MSEKTRQIISVDVRKLGMGMSHAFQGMSEVCASLGVPQDSMLSAVDEAEALGGVCADSNGEAAHTAGDAPGKKQEAAKQAVQETTSVTGAKGGAKRANKTDEAAPGMDPVDSDGVDSPVADTAPPVKEGRKKAATADDIGKVLTTKVKQKMITSADAKALLEKYGAKSVSTLDPRYYDVVLEEASSM